MASLRQAREGDVDIEGSGIRGETVTRAINTIASRRPAGQEKFALTY
jgi:hypothetical protein